MSSVGIVVIGRNEGHRLVDSLLALVHLPCPCIYVDSASHDNSVQEAKRLGVEVLELDEQNVLTAALARNLGVAELDRTTPALKYIQFVDGDTVLSSDWLEMAERFLDSHPEVAAVCGHLRERFVDRSIFNRLCDMEWQGDVGSIETTGGIFMVRRSEFSRVGGFRAASVAGEEADLCRKLQRCGWRIERIDVPMGEHDAAIECIGQWWTRAMRGGYGYAERAISQFFTRHAQRDRRRLASRLFWGFCTPVFLILFAILSLWWPWYFTGVCLIVSAQLAMLLRVYRTERGKGRSKSDARLYSIFCSLSKYPEAIGILRCIFVTCTGGRSRWIEYRKSGCRTN